MRSLLARVGLACLSAFLITTVAEATTVDFQFGASLQTGNLAGTTFVGIGSFDNQGSTGMGLEFLNLTSLDFILLGVTFTKADIDQGGQATLQDGVLTNFTAAFFPPPPGNSPVSNIAFGFGGPGLIGYSNPGILGSGAYTVSLVPEPAALPLLVAGFFTLTALRYTFLRRRT
jgi:hypothetical protein